jgi:MYXO-CTERM domain-containing protein
VLLAFRVFWLTLFAAVEHFSDGLAYPTLALSALIGWRGWRPFWALPLIVIPAVYASDLYSHASGGGKLPGAMSNVFFQLGAFALLALAGFLAGRLIRRQGLPRAPKA